jgi:hypothetical protein
MVNEAIIIELGPNGGDPIQFVCASGTAIAKGAILAMSEPRTATMAASKHQMVAGIAAQDKAADDYSDSIAVYQKGIYDMQVGSEAIATGAFCGTSGANFIIPVSISGSNVLGVMMEDGAAGEVAQVRIKL